MAFETEIWLSVIGAIPAKGEVRKFWNVKENATLDVVTAADRLWLGVTRAVTPAEPRSPGAAGRVFDLLFLLGTTPTYRLPVITDGLIAQVVEAFDADAGDDLPATPRPNLIDFLRERRGKVVAPEDRVIAP